jgi:probable F420-dependent oxidoreductase
MRFSYAESMVDPSMYLSLAQAADEAGYHGMVIPDSLCYPEVSDSTYPFSPDGTREFLEDKPFIEPFSLIPALGVVTRRIRFITFVLKLPMRHPLLVAKQATSVAVMTDNRLVLGVGVSPWPDDYQVLDIPWEGRGRRMDESIDVVRGLSAGGYFEYHGEVFDIPSVKISPVPTRPIPVVVGGHAPAALRRAARADGWVHGGGDPADLPGLLEKLRTIREEMGTADQPFEVHVISLDSFSVDGIHRLEEQGVTDVIVGFRWPYTVGADTEPLQQKLDNLRRYADDVIAKVAP